MVKSELGEFQMEADQSDQEAAKALLRDVRGIKSDILDEQTRYWRGLLGDRLDEMLSSRAATEYSFLDPEPRIRQGAFSLVALHWKPDFRIESACRRAVSSDPDFNVRAAALSCLIGLYIRIRN